MSAAYDHDFDKYDDLNHESNMSPSLLYYKEKEYFNPLPSRSIIKSYITPARVKVNNSQLINYKGKKYSVDRKYIDKYVQPKEFNNKLLIYYIGKVINVHNINENPINYSENHYRQTLGENVKDEKMDEVVKNNFNIMDNILKSRKVTMNKFEAVKSKVAMIAYLASKNNNYINHYISRLTKDNRRDLYKQLCSVVPYVEDEEQFIKALKDATKNGDVKKLKFNFWYLNLINDESFLSNEGVNKLQVECKKDIETLKLNTMKENINIL